ncbi:hypothetical protein [Jiella avicenniae]|uniref:DNA primase/helicase n=1 Tax=Jiella avicenniae TaxID=2907202 RepID=A0A9X1T9K7_9HYPH|nr:hypothetical protein [Jiella avicenniae]MCE7026413.1 hypothetical protein [Jiella avicenniae]
MPSRGDDDFLPSANAGLADVKAMIADAEDEDAAYALELGRGDPLPGQKFEGVTPGEWEPGDDGLPDSCPVLPLGTEEGVFHFIDVIGQLRSFKGSELGQSGINELFMGRHLWLQWAWPQYNKDKAIVGWRANKAREDLMGACGRKGSWNAIDRVRGRGGWTGRDGRLMFHAGNRLVSLGLAGQGRASSGLKKEAIGELDGMVYPTRPPLPKPWPVSLIDQDGPATALLPHFQTWHWMRPDLDPVLLIGWLGAAYLGAALRWRPAIVIMGDKATGKSSLQEDVKAMFGPALLQSADATAAGIYQQLKFDCLPVAVDEFEAKADTRKAKAVLELMRLSASGAPMHRGGDNHKGTQFQGRSAFAFSAINIPPLDPQDLSRLALLRLKRLREGEEKPIIPVEELAVLGRKIMRRLLDNWHRWPATYQAWRRFLASCGHDGRGQDTFGTLMALADMIVDRDAGKLNLCLAENAEDYEPWREVLSSRNLIEYEGMFENWQNCLNHVMSKRIEAWRGGTRHTVGEVLTEFFEADVNNQDAIGYQGARKLLEQTGLTLLRPGDGRDDYALFIPNQHPALFELFAGSKWQGEMNAGTWIGALDQAPMALVASGRIDGRKHRGRAFLLKDIIAEVEG